MDNKQLLERAAKAAGYEYIKPIDEYDGSLGLELGTNPMRTKSWNPIQSDADAFRLMVDCGLTVEITEDDCEAWTIRDDRRLWHSEAFGHHHNDKHAATRMAIVRAASRNAGKYYRQHEADT